MIELSRVFFPLRSNIGWFQSDNLRLEIENRIKQAILIFDELYIEDGTYTASVLQGSSASNLLPPGFLPPEDRVIQYDRDLKPGIFTLAMGSEGEQSAQVVMQGMTEARFKIDYFEIFKGVDISSSNFIKLVLIPDYKIPGAVRSQISRDSFKDINRFSDLEEGNTFLRDLIVNTLNRDLLVSVLLDSALVLDYKHKYLLNKKASSAPRDLSIFQPPESVVVNQLLSVAAPNFSEMSVLQVLELREHELWCEFRNFVRSLSSEVLNDPICLLDPRHLESVISRKIDKALFDALEKKHVTGLKFVGELAFGIVSLIPSASIASTVWGGLKAFGQYAEDRSGWFAFLLRVKDQGKRS